MKKYLIITITTIMLIFTILALTYKVKAVGIDDMGDLSSYTQEEGDNSELVDLGNIIVWIVRRVGESVSVLTLSIVGIKYIMGSVEEKAEYKQTMWPYIIGAILIFIGAEFTNIIYSVFNP